MGSHAYAVVGKGMGCPFPCFCERAPKLCGCNRFCLPVSLADPGLIAALQLRGIAYLKSNDIAPEMVSKNSNQKRIWKCSVYQSHEWEATPNTIVSGGSGCPSCLYKTEHTVRNFVDSLPTMSVAIGRTFP